ncbi:Flp family type IVb pilin [Cupriavidus sp. UYPR2.512]|uniref:Flp family type IVb pilin n=1 Tax=Cupriavidus sp. UYPR2.512 TaxID=1080187 RepID=UPI0003801687|nr:Flp family type IVb pilin [Cupriavidus sp. UYPR2.512]UIF86859.1 Flp family type IVb pilin [Cupriavidus necator]
MFKQAEGVVAFIRAERGVTSIEYALIAMLIALVIISSVMVLGQKVGDLYDTVARAMP